MSAIPYEQQEEQWHPDEGEDTLLQPGRPRRKFFGRGTAILLAAIVGILGFIAGVKVEKSNVTVSSSGATLSLPSAARGGAAAGGAGGGGRSLGGFPGAAGGGGNGASIGTVASISGRTIYVTTTSGNTVKVQLSSATKIKKSLGVGRKAIRPGDSVVVQGVSGSNGRVSASSLSDSGASGTSTGGSSSGGSTGTGAANSGSGVSSLFGSSSGG
jgi:Domain of unknown function (DUF5666)